MDKCHSLFFRKKKSSFYNIGSSSSGVNGNGNNYQASGPVVGDVNLLSAINTGSTFGKANPLPVFETAYPPTQNFGQASSSQSLSTSTNNAGNSFNSFQAPML
jgi:hypothetical protein